jgi:hypothetical protein
MNIKVNISQFKNIQRRTQIHSINIQQNTDMTFMYEWTIY